MKRNYELLYVIKAYLPDNVRNEVYNYIDKTIKDVDGDVIFKDIWGKRYMAYKIKSQKEGYYVIYQIKIESENLKKLENKLGLKEEIIRFMISNVSDKEVGVSYGKKTLSEKTGKFK